MNYAIPLIFLCAISDFIPDMGLALCIFGIDVTASCRQDFAFERSMPRDFAFETAMPRRWRGHEHLQEAGPQRGVMNVSHHHSGPNTIRLTFHTHAHSCLQVGTAPAQKTAGLPRQPKGSHMPPARQRGPAMASIRPPRLLKPPRTYACTQNAAPWGPS